MRTLDQIEAIVARLPAGWRRFCEPPFGGACACMGCVNRAPREADRLTREEWDAYVAAHGREEICLHCGGAGKIMRLT